MKKYPAKLLLFGEYTIINGSKALAMPLHQYYGYWVKETTTLETQRSHQILVQFADYLATFSAAHHFDKTALQRIKTEQWAFQSNIPQGYGLGSSGALCAAFYDTFALQPLQSPFSMSQITFLKTLFAEMEAFFHGPGSGGDPLICYLNQPVLFQDKTTITTTVLPNYNTGQGGLFLLNTHQPRKAEPLITYFVKKCKRLDFKQLCIEELSRYTDNCITAYLNQNSEQLFENIHLLSKFQYQHLPPMIPKFMRSIWQQGLDSQIYTLKICGAGGGGFVLGFTRDFEATQQLLARWNLECLHDL